LPPSPFQDTIGRSKEPTKKTNEQTAVFNQKRLVLPQNDLFFGKEWAESEIICY
jgi:hypothetical protein